MTSFLHSLSVWAQQYPQWHLVLSLCVLLLISLIADFIVKRILVAGLIHILKTSSLNSKNLLDNFSFISRLAHIVPALIISAGITYIPHLPQGLSIVVHNVSNAIIIFLIARVISSLLNVVNNVYELRPEAKSKPIKGFIQVIKIALFVIAIILMLAAIFDRSPFILLSGLGAMAAVLMLIFQDTLLSLVASIQISSNDVLRVGDWVEMPNLNADGDVIDIALHTVKIQNWDKTITTIPTRKFMTDPFKNWRGMRESGGRRIKRSILIDQQSVQFLSDEQIDKLRRFRLLQSYLVSKQEEIDNWNAKLQEQGKEPVNTRRITNIGSFRAYVLHYLKSHWGINQDMIAMVRQLAPSEHGLPLELYCFTNTVLWVEYEGIQSDIFDHLLSILPEFDLRVYQSPSGMDIKELGRALSFNKNE